MRLRDRERGEGLHCETVGSELEHLSADGSSQREDVSGEARRGWDEISEERSAGGMGSCVSEMKVNTKRPRLAETGTWCYII